MERDDLYQKRLESMDRLVCIIHGLGQMWLDWDVNLYKYIIRCYLVTTVHHHLVTSSLSHANHGHEYE